eukprot:scaffold13708_cov116-Isochrysis_galbana.AAC.10
MHSRWNLGAFQAPPSRYRAPLHVPSRLTHLGDSAFSLCISLTAVTFPAGLTHIGKHVFDECTRLETVTFPTSLIAHESRVTRKSEGTPAGLTHPSPM